jgi:hypothetical protein
VSWVVVEFTQNRDRAVDDLQDDPLGLVAGQLASFEDFPADLVADPAVVTGLGECAVRVLVGLGYG